MFSLIAIAITLFVIPACVSGQTPANATCYRSIDSNGVEARHCLKALETIAYDSYQRLDGLSSTVFTWHKTCVINIKKNKLLTPTRQMIEANVRNVLQMCPGRGGLLNFPVQVRTTVYRSTPYNVYEVNRPVCQKKRCRLTPNDCLAAFNQFAVDARGNFQLNSPSTTATSGNCTVTMSTTDYSSFRTSRSNINTAINSLVNGCRSHPGAVYVNGGTDSYNGDIKLMTKNLRTDNCI